MARKLGTLAALMESIPERSEAFKFIVMLASPLADDTTIFLHSMFNIPYDEMGRGADCWYSCYCHGPRCAWVPGLAGLDWTGGKAPPCAYAVIGLIKHQVFGFMLWLYCVCFIGECTACEYVFPALQLSRSFHVQALGLPFHVGKVTPPDQLATSCPVLVCSCPAQVGQACRLDPWPSMSAVEHGHPMPGPFLSPCFHQPRCKLAMAINGSAVCNATASYQTCYHRRSAHPRHSQ